MTKEIKIEAVPMIGANPDELDLVAQAMETGIIHHSVRWVTKEDFEKEFDTRLKI